MTQDGWRTETARRRDHWDHAAVFVLRDVRLPSRAAQAAPLTEPLTAPLTAPLSAPLASQRLSSP